MDYLLVCDAISAKLFLLTNGGRKIAKTLFHIQGDKRRHYHEKMIKESRYRKKSDPIHFLDKRSEFQKKVREDFVISVVEKIHQIIPVPEKAQYTVMAPEKVMGILRKLFEKKQSSLKIQKEITKELTHQPTSELDAVLKKHAWMAIAD